MAQWTVFTDSEFWKCSWAHAVISMTESFLFFRAVLCEGLNIPGIQDWFLPSSLVHRVFFQYLVSFENITYGRNIQSLHRFLIFLMHLWSELYVSLCIVPKRKITGSNGVRFDRFLLDPFRESFDYWTVSKNMWVVWFSHIFSITVPL